MKKIKQILKNKKIIIAIISVVILGLGLVATYYWYIGTPQYSLKQLRKGYEEHNSEEVLKYVDVDSIFENYWKEIQQKMMEEFEDTDNGFAMLGAMLGKTMIENMKPVIKEKMKQSIIDAVEDDNATSTTSTSTITSALSGTEFKFKKKGKDVLVENNENKFRFRMIQMPERYWRIVEVEDTSDDKNSTSTATSTRS